MKYVFGDNTMNTFFRKYFPQFGIKKGQGQAHPLTLESPFSADKTIIVDGDQFADMFPRKAMPGTTGMIFFKGPFRWTDKGFFTLDHVTMIVPEATLDAPVSSKANQPVHMTGNVLVQEDALVSGQDTFINVMSFIILTSGDVAFLPIPDVSEAKVSFVAPKPRALK